MNGPQGQTGWGPDPELLALLHWKLQNMVPSPQRPQGGYYGDGDVAVGAAHTAVCGFPGCLIMDAFFRWMGISLGSISRTH